MDYHMQGNDNTQIMANLSLETMVWRYPKETFNVPKENKPMQSISKKVFFKNKDKIKAFQILKNLRKFSVSRQVL